MPSSIIRVLVVDDSVTVRSLLKRGLSQHPQIEVVGTAVDGVDALAKIKALRPDVVTLDIEMPRLNGIGVLERVVGKAPVSFVMVSTLTQTGARITFEALRKGAVDYVTKPQAAGPAASAEFRQHVQEKVIAAARVRGRRLHRAGTRSVAAAPSLPPNRARGWVVGIGISCGGPQTLHEMLPAFPSDFVPIVLTQHMPAMFTGPFAQHLNASCAMTVREAGDGEPLEPGTILVAPGDQHLCVVRRGAQLFTRLDSGPPVSGHRPSVDVMFKSLAKACGPRTVAVIMTGMGRDGADGMVELRKTGAHTIAQDEQTSYVYGMPKAAAATGSVEQILPVSRIPLAVARVLEAGRPTAVYTT
jgi:two-component system chemotaxis response regulator CheB